MNMDKTYLKFDNGEYVLRKLEGSVSLPNEEVAKYILVIEKPNSTMIALATQEGVEAKSRWNVVDTAYYNARPDLYEGWVYLENL